MSFKGKSSQQNQDVRTQQTNSQQNKQQQVFTGNIPQQNKKDHSNSK